MRRLAGLILAALAALPGIASAETYHFYAGAGMADITPPLAGTAAGAAADGAFAPALASCPTAVFSSMGTFALQEPTTAADGGGAPCDVNANGRWDGIYADNGTGPMTGVHDPLQVRAVAISDGRHIPVVYASVDVIGLFDSYTDLARADLLKRYGVHAALVVSANHNESSPDTIGLYGGDQTPLGVGVRSGIDQYYMAFLADRIARAAADAVHALAPAALYANQVQTPLPAGQSGSTYPLLTGLRQRISDQFPTSVALHGDDRVAAVDPKLGVLQARGTDGSPIFTVISIAAHNQEMGNAGSGTSADWPGQMVAAFDAGHAGMAMFLVGDNGSEEDPSTDPAVIPNGSENHTNQATQFIQAKATGEQFARVAAGAAAGAARLTPGPVHLTRRQICVPLENNGFLALAAAGDFGSRQAWACSPTGSPIAAIPNGSVLPTTGAQFRTYVAYAQIGPDFQFLDNPGESFPALMLGSPFGASDESCNRPNPAVPTWHANGVFRFQVGLADDLLGYLLPAWAFASGTPGLFNNDTCYQDMNGHGHKLESESVGPTGANDVADTLAGLLERRPDPSAHVVTGRYVLANGSLSRWPTGATGIWLSGSGTVLRGVFMDYDGQPQAAPDVTTRGVMLLRSDGCVAARYYVNVFPDLTTPAKVSTAGGATGATPTRSCGALMRGGVPELQPGAAAAAGLPVR